jgi:hypothetical protein
MRIRTAAVPALLLLAVSTAAALTAPEPSGTPAVARFDNVPARPLAPEDLEISVAVPRSDDVEGDMVRREFDLRDREGVVALKDAVIRLSRLAESQDAYGDAHRERVKPFRFDLSSSGKRRALAEVLALTDELLASPGADAARDRTVLALLERHHAIDNSFRYPVKRNYQVVPEIVPMLLIEMKKHKSVGEEGARSAAVPADPPPSSFWSPPGDVGAKDLHAGFGRTSIPRHDEVCAYAEAKTGWGAHPGFEVTCGGTRLEFKLGDEIYGGPFNTRIFDALGYHTYAIDRMSGLKVRYDRRMLSDYNSRRHLAMRALLLFVPVKTHVITKIEDPFARIEAAVLSDGTRLSGAALKRALLRDGAVVKGRPRPETVASNYVEDFERRIDHLVWQPGTVAYEPPGIRAIGAWDYDQLDHAARREVRAVFTLAAWLDQYNMRWENTRLAYVKDGDGWALRHLFSDVGSGLSAAPSMISGTNSDIERMPWEVTERRGGKVRFSGFAVNVMNDAFDDMTAEDARWMADKLAALSERQILQALLATSMTAAEARLALEKLVSKRQKLVADLGLSSAYPEIASRRVDRSLDFDPERPADIRAVTLTLADGTTVAPAAGGSWIVREGHLVARGAQAADATPAARAREQAAAAERHNR